MRDKADDVVGSAVNKPIDVLLTNVACGFHDCPSDDRKTHIAGRGISKLLELRCARGRGRWLENSLQIYLFPVSRQTKLSVCTEREVRVWTLRFWSWSLCSWTQSPRSLT